jgi:hypothetical protein
MLKLHEQIVENMKALDVIPLLTPEVVDRIEAAVQSKPKRTESYRWSDDSVQNECQGFLAFFWSVAHAISSVWCLGTMPCFCVFWMSSCWTFLWHLSVVTSCTLSCLFCISWYCDSDYVMSGAFQRCCLMAENFLWDPWTCGKWLSWLKVQYDVEWHMDIVRPCLPVKVQLRLLQMMPQHNIACYWVQFQRQSACLGRNVRFLNCRFRYAIAVWDIYCCVSQTWASKWAHPLHNLSPVVGLTNLSTMILTRGMPWWTQKTLTVCSVHDNFATEKYGEATYFKAAVLSQIKQFRPERRGRCS